LRTHLTFRTHRAIGSCCALGTNRTSRPFRTFRTRLAVFQSIKPRLNPLLERRDLRFQLSNDCGGLRGLRSALRRHQLGVLNPILFLLVQRFGKADAPRVKE
jgi:hypothetical protein